MVRKTVQTGPPVVPYCSGFTIVSKKSKPSDPTDTQTALKTGQRLHLQVHKCSPLRAALTGIYGACGGPGCMGWKASRINRCAHSARTSKADLQLGQCTAGAGVLSRLHGSLRATPRPGITGGMYLTWTSSTTQAPRATMRQASSSFQLNFLWEGGLGSCSGLQPG